MASKLVLTLTALSLVACSSSVATSEPTTDVLPTVKPISSTPRSSDTSKGAARGAVATTSYGQAWCQWLFECNPIAAATSYADAASCAAQKDAELSPYIDVQGTGVTQAGQIACTAAVASATCDTRLDEIAICRFKGTHATNDGCFADVQCASGYCRRVNGTDTCGVCIEPAAEGESCTGIQCQDGLVCGVTNTCEVRKQTGESGCGAVGCAAATDVCMSDTCQAPLDLGASCAIDPVTSADPCALSQGAKCIDGTCSSAVPTAHVGDNCATDDGPSLACANSWCDANTTNQCLALLTEGAACDPSTQPCGGLMTCTQGVCTVVTQSTATFCP